MTRRQWLALLSANLSAGCTTLRPTPPVAPLPSDAAFAWPSVLQEAVDDRGRIDFRRLAANRGALELAIASVGATAPNNRPDLFPLRQDQLAFHINAYNALAMYAVLRDGVPERLSLLDRAAFFGLTSVIVGGESISLGDYGNGIVRDAVDERLHFALNCMAVSCPGLPRTPFTAAGLETELNAAARLFFAEPRNVQVDPARRAVRLSSILDINAKDFLRRAPTLVAYANQYRSIAIPMDYTAEFISFDWTINAQPPP